MITLNNSTKKVTTLNIFLVFNLKDSRLSELSLLSLSSVLKKYRSISDDVDVANTADYGLPGNHKMTVKTFHIPKKKLSEVLAFINKQNFKVLPLS